ncbi:N-terminal C2 in EEIG1 and EHBP1 proteins-domain-containing protein [Phlyctochytrium arcticum]|nr:N-terminal C2 in EEIG1 and EHBP1 proteins-domain-containing protein [Phlyctochytrium arcticum]
MTSLFVSKARKVKFEVYCHVHDLTNLPYVSGLYYVKWKLKQGGSSEGTTAKCVVKDHTVNWDASFRLEPTMIIGKDGVLLPCELTLYVRQLVGRSSEDVGRVSINLAEYAASRSKSKRFLLQESRLNSIIRVALEVRQIKGGLDYFWKLKIILHYLLPFFQTLPSKCPNP